MTRGELRELKSKTVEDLIRSTPDKDLLDRADVRLWEYVDEVRNNPDKHNLYELLALKRFILFLNKYLFKPEQVTRFVTLYEFLKFPGINGATSYKLTPVQVFQFASIKGFFHKGDPERRLTREGLLFVPRKFSKTTSVASLAIDEFLFGDSNSEGYVGANSYDQAHICFGVIQQCLKNLDPKMRRFKVNREQVFNLSVGRTSTIRCLASSPDKLDGLNASLVIMDEYSQAESAALKNVLTSSMGARKNPLTIVITTASDKTETPFYNQLESYKAVLRGEYENDSIFAHIFEPDIDDDESDPETWRKVHPHIGVTVNEEFYTEEYKKAIISSDDMQVFRNKLLNIFAKKSEIEWITSKDITDRMTNDREEDFRNVLCVCSVDLSVRDDFSAVTYLLYNPKRELAGYADSVPFHSFTDYYFPNGALANHPNAELYRQWEKKGAIKFVDGEVIDYRLIVKDMLSKPFKIVAIGYDPYKSKEFVRMLEYTPTIGKRYLYAIPQTYGAFTSPVESFELSMYTNRITFGDNPITAYCFENAVIDEDRLENRKPIKRKATMKIDGCITNIMCFYLINTAKISA